MFAFTPVEAASTDIREDFETGSFSKSWTVAVGKKALPVSKDKSHGGSYGAQVTPNSVQRYSASLSKQAASVWIYDDQNYSNTCAVMKLTDGDRGIIFGVNTAANASEYVVRAGDAAAPWAATGVKRTSGWHQFKIDFTGEKAVLSIDNKQVLELEGYENFDGVELGDYWAKLDKELYMDDFEITSSKAPAPVEEEPVQKQELKSPTAVGFRDVDSETSGMVEILAALGIMNGYDDNTFKPDNSVTRGEFAAVVVKALGYGEQGETPVDTVFTDVDHTKWFSGYVKIASDMALINGVGGTLFDPDSAVTQEEAVKIVVSALGYGEYAEIQGGYPRGYITIANRQDLINGSVFDGQAKMKRKDVVNLIYNALNVDLMQLSSVGESNNYKVIEGATLLTKNFHLKKINGVLRTVENRSIVYGEEAGENAIILGDELYRMNNAASVAGLIGYNVDCYVNQKESGEVRMLVKSKKNKDLLIAADDIVGAEIEQLRYEDASSKVRTLNLSGIDEVLYNGRSVFDYTAEDLKPDNGMILLIDNDANGSYDILSISTFDTVMVESKNSSTKSVYNKLDGQNYLLDEDKLKSVTITKDGEKASFDDIQEKDVLCIFQDKDKTIVIAEIVSVIISGTVSEINHDDGRTQVKVGGKEYTLSTAFEKAVQKQEIQLGAAYNMYLDREGKAAYVTVDSNRLQYAYLIAVASNGNRLDNKFLAFVLTDVGKTAEVPFADKVVINNGTQIKSEEVWALLGETEQIVKYQTNGDGEIKKLYTAVTQESDDDGDEQLVLNKQYTTKAKARYKSTPNALCINAFVGVAEPGQTPEYLLASDVVIFRISQDENGKFDEEYSGVETSIANDTLLVCDVYDATKTNEVKALKIVMESKADGGTDVVSNIVVDSVGTSLNADGEEVRCLYGWQEGVMTEFQNVTAENVDKLQRFDVVRLRENVLHEIYSVEVISDNMLGKIRLSASRYFVKGRVVSKEDGIIRVAYNETGGSDSYRVETVGSIWTLDKNAKEPVKSNVSEIRSSRPGTLDGSYVIITVENFLVKNILILD